MLLPLIAISTLAIYLLVLLNRQLKNTYCWQRKVEYKDYINKQTVTTITSTETLTITNINARVTPEVMLAELESAMSESGTIPFKLSILSYIADFYATKDVLSSLLVFQDSNINLFLDDLKIDGPSFFIEKNIYNIFVKYSIYKDLDLKPVSIKSNLDYKRFLDEIYKFQDNYTCKVTYCVYNKIGRDEKANKALEVSLILNIGPAYSNINYGKAYITSTEYLD
jgi:hypothetical protein